MSLGDVSFRVLNHFGEKTDPHVAGRDVPSPARQFCLAVHVESFGRFLRPVFATLFSGNVSQLIFNSLCCNFPKYRQRGHPNTRQRDTSTDQQQFFHDWFSLPETVMHFLDKNQELHCTFQEGIGQNCRNEHHQNQRTTRETLPMPMFIA